MPTLIEDEEVIEETARPSDMAWVAQEFDQGQEYTGNDTTLSGSLLMAAMDDFRRNQNHDDGNTPSHMLSPSDRKDRTEDVSISLLASPDLLLLPKTPRFTPRSVQMQKQLSADDIVIAPRAHVPLSPGPNQQAYEDRYKTFVERTIIESHKRFPGRIPRYSDLSPEKQRTEQVRVLRLLERLQIGGRQVADEEHENVASPLLKRSQQLPYSSVGKKKSISFAAGNQQEVLFSPEPPHDCEPMDRSIALLSPIPRNDTPSIEDGSVGQHSSSNSPASPVEFTRAAARFSSPMTAKPASSEDDNDQSELLSYRKRMATTSGKRGLDTSRRKHADESTSSSDGLLLPSMDFESPAPKIFSASQSPILSDADDADADKDGLRHVFNARQRQYDSDSSSTASAGVNNNMGWQNDCDPDESLETIDETTTSCAGDRPLPPLACVTNNIVQLKKGASVHYHPLATKRQPSKSKKMTQTFPDPLAYYSGKTGEKMQATYQWIRNRLHLSQSVPRGALVFSLSEEKIMDICLKLTIRSSEEESVVSPPGTLPGQTLIVIRERDSLIEWKRTFREGSSLGVICHAELPPKERKSTSTARKCAEFGVVLTTFDALSSPDSNVLVEDEGIAIVEQCQSQNGWLQARGSSQMEGQNKCKRLSVLHRLHWKQVIFVDWLGRKSFLLKPDTARNKAAAAIATDARLLFFAKNEECQAGFSELIKSDKKAICGVASVLHVEWDSLWDGDCSGGGLTLDYQHAIRIHTKERRRAKR